MPKQQCPAPTVLGANVEPGPDSPLMALPEEQQIKPYTIKTFTNGEKVGVVGIGIKDSTMNGGVDKGTVLVDEKVAAQAAVDELTCKGINKIVMLTHIGCGPLGVAYCTRVHAPSPACMPLLYPTTVTAHVRAGLYALRSELLITGTHLIWSGWRPSLESMSWLVATRTPFSARTLGR